MTIRALAVAALIVAAVMPLGTHAQTPAPSPSPVVPSPAPSRTAPASPAALPSLSPSPAAPGSPIARPDEGVPPLFVRGQVLAIGSGFFIFTTGDSVRVASGLVIPGGVTTGSFVRLTIDQLAREITNIELEPKTTIAGEIDAANIPRQYIVISPKSAPAPAATGQTTAASQSLVTVTIVVHVPGNTPTSDDVYLATERSNYSPAEVRMDRVDGSTFSTSVSIAGGTTLKYQFTRGTYATVERDRTGGEVPAHTLVAAPNAKSSDTVARWADLS